MKNMGKMSKIARNNWINYGIVLVFFLIIQIVSGTGHLTSSLGGQLVPICAYIVMAISLNLVVGISGELSLGHAGFMSVGAFTGAIAATSLAGAVTIGPLRLALAILLGAAAAAIMGVIVGIPVLRLRGDYLAIVTLAFGEIIKNVVNCLYVGKDAGGLHLSTTGVDAMGLDSTGTVIVNGPMGVLGITKISTFVAGIILILITLMVIQNLINSRAGRATMAIRDNRIAAESCGLNITHYKLMAFVTSAAFAGAAGALYAMNFSTIVAKKFDFNTSILILVFVVLGGIGNMRGSVIAAALLTILPEILRPIKDFRMLAYAIVLILVMLATNNETLKEFWQKTVAKLKPKKATKPGGVTHE